MGLIDILVFCSLALLYTLLLKGRGRIWVLLAGSVLAVFWLQPATPVRNLDFWLPVLTLALALLGWALTAPREVRTWKDNWRAAALTGGIVLLVALTRYLSLSGILTRTRPPATLLVLAALALVTLLAWLITRPSKAQAGEAPAGKAPAGKTRTGWLWGGIVLLIGLLVVLKLPPLAQAVSALLRALMSQKAELASAIDLRWLGFSYVAFRLIHTLRERQNGRLPAVSLAEYLVYMIFFPALAAGPIDRIERFVKDLRKPLVLTVGNYLSAGQRLVIGLFKKFALADTLAIVALNAVNAAQVGTAGWTWLLLYAYAFQIFFDFSGYTDIAIGMGRLFGVQLPENFNAPYLKSNLTLFWNNWHMTLTQWFRAYFFNPVTRWLRTRPRSLPPTLIILVTQLSTMALIGLWHGITWNFVLWGAWHGLGLFVQNRYSDWIKLRLARMDEHPRLKKALEVGGVLLTFHYVALGWVWFALPSPGLSLRVFGKLLGV
jgi:alginate O-acetyltransferase complex protein AlgI